MREKKEGETERQEVQDKLRGEGGGWNIRTRLHWCILSFVVSSPDPLTLYILLKGWRGWRERRDGSYKHSLHICVCPKQHTMQTSYIQMISVKMLQSSVCLSGVIFRTPLPSSLPVCLHPLPAESCGGGTMASPTFPLSCREHSFVSRIPFPIHLFLSLSSWSEKKSLHGGGVCLKKWNQSPWTQPHPSSFLSVLLG